MVKYYYDKYNAISTTTYTDNSPWENTSNTGVYMQRLSKGYSFSKSENKYLPTGETYGNEYLNAGAIGYYVSDGNAIQKNVLTTGGRSDKEVSAEVSHKLASKNSKKVSYSRGTLIQSNIQAENGTYPTDGLHTDGFWYVRKGIVNEKPTITPSGTVPSESLSTKPSFNYSVSDPDGNPMTVTESIDGIVFNTRTGVASGSQLTFTPTDLAWLRTRIKQTVNVTITANDGKGGVTTVNYPIIRTTPSIDLQLKTPFETDVAAKRILLKLEGSIPLDAVVNVQVCNNAFDTFPTWENATNLVLSGFPHQFNNTVKTAAKWGISFKIRIERGTSTQSIYLDGVGGAFD